jgi:hypothetical protein
VLGAATHYDEQADPDARGHFVLERLLCRPTTVAHPAGVPLSLPAGATTRDAGESVVLNPACADCHADSARLGFTLQSFDAVGKYRTTENDLAIDTQVELPELGVVENSVDLVEKLATLPETQACFVQRWLEFASGRTLEAKGDDQCLQDHLTQAFEASDFNVRQLLLELTQTGAFLFLAKE